MAGIPISAGKRLTLQEKLSHIIVGDNDDELIAFLEETEKDEIDAIGFRHTAPATQARQDRHLTLYHRFVSVWLKLPPDATTEDLDEQCFPTDFALLYKLLRLFLITTYKFSNPRSISAGLHMSYFSLGQYRDSMLFWVIRVYNQRGVTPPNRIKVFNEMTEAMRSAQRKYGSGKELAQPKTYLGLQELRQLIDYDLSITPCIELSEEHQAAWCIGRITAIRPGSIGPSKLRTDCLRWKDTEFTLTRTPGRFDVTITFRNIKTNRDDPEAALKSGVPSDVLTFKVRAANENNIIFSVPHRLLTIALRRGLLDGIDTLDQLMNTKARYITIKSAHLEDPIFYSGGPRGLSIDKSKPLSSAALSKYICTRAYGLGYDQGISFYGIRRRSATDAVRRIGLEATREIMAHSPDSRTLELYYLATRPTLDMTAVQLNEDIGVGGHSATMEREWAPLALNKLSPDRITNIQGRVLNMLTNRLSRNDPAYPVNGTDDEKKTYRRRMRRRALASLLAQEHEEQKSKMTYEDYDSRLRLADASAFADMILARARQSLDDRQRNKDDELLRASGANSLNFAEDFPDDEDEPEADVEDTIKESENAVIECDFANENDEEDVAEEGSLLGPVEYVHVATQMMTLILENTTTQRLIWQDRDQRCPLCIADPTLSHQSKGRRFNSEAHLKAHLRSSAHAPLFQWRRRMTIAHDKFPGGGWLCPYCDKSHSYFDLATLQRHVFRSSEETHGEKHDRLKRMDGWYDDDFGVDTPNEDDKGRRKAMRAGKYKTFRGIDIEDEPELQSRVPHASLPGVYHGGSPDPAQLTARFHGLMRMHECTISKEELVAWPAFLQVGATDFSSSMAAKTGGAVRTRAPPDRKRRKLLESTVGNQKP